MMWGSAGGSLRSQSPGDELGSALGQAGGLQWAGVPRYVPVGFMIFPMKSMVVMVSSVISSRKGWFSLKVTGVSMGSVCTPEPAAPSAPLSSSFSLALCTACGDQEQGQCLPSPLETVGSQGGAQRGRGLGPSSSAQRHLGCRQPPWGFCWLLSSLQDTEQAGAVCAGGHQLWGAGWGCWGQSGIGNPSLEVQGGVHGDNSRRWWLSLSWTGGRWWHPTWRPPAPCTLPPSAWWRVRRQPDHGPAVRDDVGP